MISFLRGKLVDVLPTQATIDVNGIGYDVLIPLSSYDKLPAVGNEVKLLTHLAVREDAHTLYGFMSTAEREMFRLLINTVSGIGPKLALNVLSGMSVIALRGAVANGDVKLHDSELALVAMGYKQIEALDMDRSALASLGDSATVEDLVRACFKKGA